MIETRRYYAVYAGWYGHCETDQYMEDYWSPENFTFGAFAWTGHDYVHALSLLTAYQQQCYDFCGIEVTFAS